MEFSRAELDIIRQGLLREREKNRRSMKAYPTQFWTWKENLDDCQRVLDKVNNLLAALPPELSVDTDFDDNFDCGMN